MSKFEFSGRGAAEASKPTRKKGTFLSDLTNYKAKDIIGKITNLFCIYLFQIDEFINTINIVFNKVEIYYLFT
jgi:hypothetical protein